MEIKIRDVDPIAVKKFDELAKKNKISRQVLLKSIFEKVAYEKEMTEKDARLEMLITKNIQVMELMADRVERLENILEVLMEE
ncbi:hypothetical protein [Metabacillus sp. cB07]|uniref:hypothetical protein n=1 Tax=Metabacillus sp. cB07 TaxID=2806989 RepID=UPI00193A8D37|nr:hypothetical protein [Metabacillus sp. cB07]